MLYAKSRAACEAAMQRFAQDSEAKYPKATKALGAECRDSSPISTPGGALEAYSVDQPG